MILASVDQAYEAYSAGQPIVCQACHGVIPWEEVNDNGADRPLTACCHSPAYVVERDTPKLVESHGPAWATFIAVPRVLLADRSLKWPQRLVAVALLGYLQLPEVRPAQDTLAREAGLGLTACRDALAALEARGLIVRERRYRKGDGSRLPDRIDLGPLLAYLNRLPPPRDDRDGEEPW